MALKVFAAIEVGSSALDMKIYELSKKIGIRQLDHVRSILELGADAYSDGKISFELVNELCAVLKKFKLKMDEYQVEDYVAYGGSALREASNSSLIINQIRLKTGLKVKLMSNAQQRYLILKSIAFKMSNFEELIKEGAVVIDLGAGSSQVSVFCDGVLSFSENIRLGSLRIRELLSSLEGQTTDFISLMTEYIRQGVRSYSLEQLEKLKLKHAIIVSTEYASMLRFAQMASQDHKISRDKFSRIGKSILTMKPNQISEEMLIPYETATIMCPTIILMEELLKKTSVEYVWETASDLCDGMALDYSQKVERFLLKHDFSKDIIKSVRYIAQKYDSDDAHIRNVESHAKELFDATKKISGLTARHRLLLQIASILHDTGKFISDTNAVFNSSHIIRETEIIGITKAEREMISCIVLYNSSAYVPAYEDMSHEIDKDSYIDMLKLSAIFGLANAMDKSHKQKIQKIRASVLEHELKISADSIYDIMLEQRQVNEKAAFFEEIFGIRPVLTKKRTV